MNKTMADILKIATGVVVGEFAYLILLALML